MESQILVSSYITKHLLSHRIPYEIIVQIITYVFEQESKLYANFKETMESYDIHYDKDGERIYIGTVICPYCYKEAPQGIEFRCIGCFENICNECCTMTPHSRFEGDYIRVCHKCKQ